MGGAKKEEKRCLEKVVSNKGGRVRKEEK